MTTIHVNFSRLQKINIKSHKIFSLSFIKLLQCFMERAATLVENSDSFSRETKTSYDLVKYKTKLKSLNKIRVTSSLHKGDSKYERAQLGGGAMVSERATGGHARGRTVHVLEL